MRNDQIKKKKWSNPKKRHDLFPFSCKLILNVSKKKKREGGDEHFLSFNFSTQSSNSFKSIKLNCILSNKTLT